MVEQERRRPDNRTANNLQDVDVQGVPRPLEGQDYDEDDLWFFNLRAMLAHDKHIQIRPGVPSEACAVCREGPSAILARVEPEQMAGYKPPGLVPHPRDDSKGPSTSPPPSWWDENDADR